MPSIIVDSREAVNAPDIVESLRASFDVEIKYSESGDYLMGNGIGIERKTLTDFSQSIIKRRLWDQLEQLCNSFERPLLLLELSTPGLFTNSVYYTGIGPQERGAILNLIYSWKKLKFHYTLGRAETISFLKRSAMYAGPSKRIPIPKVVRKAASPDEIYKNMLMCVRGIGPKAANNIYRKYSNFTDLVQCSVDDLTSIPGIGVKYAKLLYKTLHGGRIE